MTSIRPFVDADVPNVVALFERVYPGHRWASPDACGAYLREVVLGNPWRAKDLPSWVGEDDGRIVGFAGVVPRPMVFTDRPIRAAVGCLLMVDPDRRNSLIALQLVRAALAGPQDLFIADGANDDARRLWTGAGGSAPLLYSLHWTRPLRPARYALSIIEGLGKFGSAARLLRPLASLADSLLAGLRPNRLHRSADGCTDLPLDAAALSSSLANFQRGSVLRPDYDQKALAWLLDQAARKSRHGKFRARAVFDRERNLIGWFIYYARQGDTGEVLQLAASDGSFSQVLQQLLYDAWRAGATALRGRLDPAHVQELSNRHCWLRREGPWTLVHSRQAHIVLAIERGDAELSRLDGEWWLRFLGG